MELSLRRHTVGVVEVLALSGEIDLATLPRLRDSLARLVDDAPGTTVAVDLDGVTVLDDTGLGIVLGAAGHARRRGGDLVAVCSEGPLRERLMLTGADRAVRVGATLHEVAFGSAPQGHDRPV